MEQADGRPPRVLLVDDDADIADLVLAILTDHGYAVSTLVHTTHDSLLAAVGIQEPDCVLLDSSEGAEYGSSWAEAAKLATRARSIPTIMFTAHSLDVREARNAQSDRARAADFAAIVSKPFGLDELLASVATACGQAEPFSESAEAHRERSLALARRLRELGATDIRTSDRREWATFRTTDSDTLHQLYWWQTIGLYIVARYEGNSTLVPVGRFLELEAAIKAAMA